MKQITALLLAVAPFSGSAHPCPYDWNIEPSESINIEAKNLEDFVTQFNEAVRKQTKDKIKRAIVLERKADAFTKVPEKSPFAKEMDTLVRRYGEVTAPLIKQGVSAYGTGPVGREFPANFPVACLLAATFAGGSVGYAETEEGAIVTIQQVLECRAYRLSEKLLGCIEEEKDSGSIPKGQDPAQYVFARCSGMRWELAVFDPKKGWEQRPIVEAVTLYLPEQKIMIALARAKEHEELTASMTERGYLLLEMGTRSSNSTQQKPNKTVEVTATSRKL